MADGQHRVVEQALLPSTAVVQWKTNQYHTPRHKRYAELLHSTGPTTDRKGEGGRVKISNIQAWRFQDIIGTTSP